ncbi:hypothetical protein [Polyangium fumosum]|uniref:Uncharacterized protein n=1 Tax=Polyangium fumosum TaxID=889272 RepID=A0A4U1IGS7_9BACT|nr:hypothetical protein [Polyangium fumosum]TKC92984.1 hypothetical protein E8A74_50245 [Polyangium fumosum]
MSGTCYRCGKKLGLFAPSKAIICEPCEKRRDGSLYAWGQALNEALRDNELHLHEELQLRQFQAKLGLMDHELSAFMPRLQYGKLLIHARAGMIPPVQAPFPLHTGEVAYFASEAFIADSRLSQVWIKGYQGRKGYNADVAVAIPLGPGRFAVTNRRLVVAGPMWIEAPAEDISFAWVRDDGVQVTLRNREAPVFVNCHQNDYAAAVLSYAGEAKGEVRPLTGRAHIYNTYSPNTSVQIFPDENALAYYETVVLAERKDEAKAFSGRMPTVPAGTIVVLGEPASDHIAFRVESGPLAGNTGYVPYQHVHATAQA